MIVQRELGGRQPHRRDEATVDATIVPSEQLRTQPGDT
jgi:hypothetical protein